MVDAPGQAGQQRGGVQLTTLTAHAGFPINAAILGLQIQEVGQQPLGKLWGGGQDQAGQVVSLQRGLPIPQVAVIAAVAAQRVTLVGQAVGDKGGALQAAQGVQEQAQGNFLRQAKSGIPIGVAGVDLEHAGIGQLDAGAFGIQVAHSQGQDCLKRGCAFGLSFGILVGRQHPGQLAAFTGIENKWQHQRRVWAAAGLGAAGHEEYGRQVAGRAGQHDR